MVKKEGFFENKIIFKIFYHFRIFDFGFYLNAFYWHHKNKTPKNITAEDIYKLFYLDFLNVPEEDCLIVEITKNKLVTRCKNKCPILDLSLYHGIDTKKSCKRISEGPCKFFLRKLDKNIVFRRNYDHIRPYKKDCEETIVIEKSHK